jgi:hypothetical protein
MNPLLALLAATSSTPASEAIGDWVKVFFFLSGGICAIVVALRKKQPITQPLVVKADQEFVTVPVHDKAITEIKAELLRHAGRRAEIYKQNEQHGKAIAALQAETAAQTRTMHQMTDQIERLPEKIKNLLLK